MSKGQSERVAPLLCQTVAYHFSRSWESDQAGSDAVPGVKWQGGTKLPLDRSQVKQQPMR